MARLIDYYLMRLKENSKTGNVKLDPSYNLELNPSYNLKLNPNYNLELNPSYNLKLNPSYNPNYMKEEYRLLKKYLGKYLDDDK